MSACLVWLDSDHAKVFSIGSNGVTKKEIKRTHHGHSNDHQDAHQKTEEQKFFKEVLASIMPTVEELLIMGSGQAKVHFRDYLETHNPPLGKKIVGIETTDHLSDNQILEKSRQFFKKFNQFHSSLT